MKKMGTAAILLLIDLACTLPGLTLKVLGCNHSFGDFLIVFPTILIVALSYLYKTTK